jgi:hypothetical protein
MTADRRHQLLEVGNGLLAGLVELGIEEFNPSIMDFETRFLKAWREWAPQLTHPSIFPVFGVGTKRPRDLLFRLHHSSSPFSSYQTDLLVQRPLNLIPRDYLEIYCDTATPEEWLNLGRAY